MKAWAEERTKYGLSLAVKVKRFTSDPLYLLWKLPDSEEVEELTVIREDLDRIQNVTWQELSLTKMADAMLETESDQRQRKVKGQLTVEQQKGTADAVRHRAANGNIQDLAGTSVVDARAPVILENNRKWDERTAAALGREKRPVAPTATVPSSSVVPEDPEYDAWLQARKAARDERRREAE